MSIYHSHQLAFAGAAQQGEMATSLREERTYPSWFRTIPPERIGLDGRYDYYGLQKRVEATFQERFDPQTLAGLSVNQRGRVVILYGRVSGREMLQRLVSLAERVEGAIRVEASCLTVDSGSSATAAKSEEVLLSSADL